MTKKPMSHRNPRLNEYQEKVFPGTAKAIEDKVCVFCRKPISGFTDALSEKEYEISGMCQECQDGFFQ